MILALLLAAAQAAPPAVDGSRLRPGTQCYALVQGEKVIGATRQTVKAVDAAGTPAWDIVVHQYMGGGRFDLRDHFVLRRGDLTPIAFDSRKSGVEHVRVAYAPGKIVTTRPGAAPVETAVTGPVWDGNLWGLTFAALPLGEGAHFELPFYHYDKGLGRFALDVVGTEQVGDQNAWVVETGEGPRKVRYRIGQRDHAELGYSGAGFAQRPGGDCSAIPA